MYHPATDLTHDFSFRCYTVNLLDFNLPKNIRFVGLSSTWKKNQLHQMYKYSWRYLRGSTHSKSPSLRWGLKLSRFIKRIIHFLKLWPLKSLRNQFWIIWILTFKMRITLCAQKPPMRTFKKWRWPCALWQWRKLAIDKWWGQAE